MGKRLYVGNLPYTISDSELQQLFEQHGSVTSAQVVMDRDTGRSKGFGFVEMGTDAEAQAAITALHGAEFGGRTLTVNEARPKPEGGGGAAGAAAAVAAGRLRWRRRPGRLRRRWRRRWPALLNNCLGNPASLKGPGFSTDPPLAHPPIAPKPGLA